MTKHRSLTRWPTHSSHETGRRSRVRRHDMSTVDSTSGGTDGVMIDECTLEDDVDAAKKAAAGVRSMFDRVAEMYSDYVIDEPDFDLLYEGLLVAYEPILRVLLGQAGAPDPSKDQAAFDQWVSAPTAKPRFRGSNKPDTTRSISWADFRAKVLAERKRGRDQRSPAPGPWT